MTTPMHFIHSPPGHDSLWPQPCETQQCLVDGDGVEPPQLEAPGLQPGGLANAQPIQYLVAGPGV